jgi:hypothetical protein
MLARSVVVDSWTLGMAVNRRQEDITFGRVQVAARGIAA